MIKFLAVLVTRMFFHKIIITGQPNKAVSGLWIANHSNGIVDPAILISIAPVFLHPLAKATLWNNLVMRLFLMLTRAIPVVRKQDADEMNQKTHGTLPPDWMKKINADAFKTVDRLLIDGDSILIFPEGVSHDNPYLHPLKTGVARMATEAVIEANAEHSKYTQKFIMIQPIIIDYTEKNEFRSSVYIRYCDPIKVTAESVSIADLMSEIQKSFKKYFVEFKTWDEKRNWQYLFKLYYGRDPASLDQFRVFFENNHQSIGNDVILLNKIQTMRCMLQVSGISPINSCWRRSVYGKTNSLTWFIMFLLRIVSFTLLTAPVSLLFTLVWGIPLTLCRILGTGLKKYNRDVYATMEIAHAMWILPVWASMISGIFTMLIVDVKDPLFHMFGVWLAIFLSVPIFLKIGLFVEEHLNFCSGYFRFGLLKLTFPRGLKEMLKEWETIANQVIQKVHS